MPDAVAFPMPGAAPFVHKSRYTTDQTNDDSQKLHKAMKGLGTDEKAIINVLGKRTPEEMDDLCRAFRHNFGQDLQKELQKETNGDFCKLLVAATTPRAEYEAELVHMAIKGAGTDENRLIEVLVGRSNADVSAIREAYKVLHGKDISQDVQGDLSGDLKDLFTSLLDGNRDEGGQHHDVERDVEALHRAGEGKIGTDERTFINLLTSRSDAHLRNVFDYYQKRYRQDFTEVVKKEFGGNLEKVLLGVVECIQNRPRWIARQFEMAMSGVGTDESRLIRLVTRFRQPSILPQVKEAYRIEHDKSLAKRIHGETNGDFRKLLLELIGEPNP